MKAIIFFFAVLIGGMIFIQQSLQNGAILKYIDEHPHGRGVPAATYYIGESYYLFQNLPDATTYFLRVSQRYPNRSEERRVGKECRSRWSADDYISV